MPFIALAVAVGLGGIASGAGAAIAGGQEASAAKNATQAQLQMYNETVAREQPFVSAGTNALAALQGGLGLGPATAGGPAAGSLVAPFNPANLAQTPGYQFQLQQGEQALQDAASATGGVGGGNALKALTQFGQGLAGTTYQQQLQDYLAQQSQIYNELSGVSTTGANAAANLGSIGTTVAGQIGSNILGAGNAAAATTAGITNSLTGGLNTLSSNYLLAQLLQGGGFGAAGGAAAGTAGLGDVGAAFG